MESKNRLSNAGKHSKLGELIAKCVIEGMKQAGLPLVKYLRTDNERYDPACPDARETFKWNESPFTELEKPDGN